MLKPLLSQLQTLWTILQHSFTRAETVQYPEQKPYLAPRYRGRIVLTCDPDGDERCVACNLCAVACPVDCIYIESEGKGKERMMTRYAIDYNKCIWCSLCTEHCPTDCITMSHDYDHSVYDRRSLVYEFMDPREQLIPCHRATRIDQGWWVPPKEEKAKPSDDKGETK